MLYIPTRFTLYLFLFYPTIELYIQNKVDILTLSVYLKVVVIWSFNKNDRSSLVSKLIV